MPVTLDEPNDSKSEEVSQKNVQPTVTSSRSVTNEWFYSARQFFSKLRSIFSFDNVANNKNLASTFTVSLENNFNANKKLQEARENLGRPDTTRSNSRTQSNSSHQKAPSTITVSLENNFRANKKLQEARENLGRADTTRSNSAVPSTRAPTRKLCCGTFFGLFTKTKLPEQTSNETQNRSVLKP